MTSWLGGQEVYVVNNGQARASSGSSNVPLAPWEEQYFRPEYVPAAVCSVDLTRPLMNVTYVGTELLGQTQVDHIKFYASSQTLPDGSQSLDPVISEFHVYLDAQSFRVVKTKRFLFSPDAIENHSDWETYYSDYRTVAGVLVSFHVQHFLAGQELEDIVLSTAQFGVSISSQDFE
jgi:hypothetical protein